MRKRVVVTGLGIVSPLGNDLETAWTACRSGRSGIGLITRFDASDLKTHIAGEVRNFEIPSVIPAKDAKKMDVLDLYAIAATQQALDDAGLKITDDIADDVGVSLGVGIGGEVTLEKKGKMRQAVIKKETAQVRMRAFNTTDRPFTLACHGSDNVLCYCWHRHQKPEPDMSEITRP